MLKEGSCEGSILCCSEHHAQFPERAEEHLVYHRLKSLIAEDIQKYLHDGKFLNMVPFREFYAKMTSYNERRVMELRCPLAAS
jgi:hypothetical protein